MVEQNLCTHGGETGTNIAESLLLNTGSQTWRGYGGGHLHEKMLSSLADFARNWGDLI